MNGYDVVAKILKAEGVEFLSAFPMQPLIDACAKIGIRPIICRQERAGVNIADGYSRTLNGRKFGVFSMQNGPGAENCFAGVAQAFADSVPMLILPGGEPLSRQGIAPTFEARRNFQHVTKWAAQIHKVEDIPRLMRHAVTQMKSGRPGPVMLEMPGDVMKTEYPGDEVEYTPVRRRESLASPEDVRELIEALLKSSSPIIVAGQGVLYSQASTELVEFSELAQLPVMSTLAGKSAFPENHPLALGTGGLTAPLTVRRFLESTDFGLGIGTSFTRNTFTTPMPDGLTLGQVTNCSEDIGKDYEVSVGAVGEVRLVLQQMIEEYKRQDGPKQRGNGQGVAQKVAAVREEFNAEWEPRLTSDEVPISPYRVFRELDLAFGDNIIITHDSGFPRNQLTPTWKSISPRSYISWGKSTQLGYGLGLSIGAKLAAPEKQVVNIMGDAAFGMSGLDLETAVRCKIPILTVVLNNAKMTGYDDYHPVATERYKINLLGGNYSKVAEGLGAHTERVDDPSNLAAAIKRAEAANREGQAALLEVLTKVEKKVAK
ncbi:MAG TPA: thiamine pyrophosphate-requiring protein [Gammaproteobacteria bacterium]|jgi:acetolactate synthase-1/2/3 large subunit|nr:thiamine pyrophosphate-requiring protein [Gammaproteobacteria bacterium]HIL71256.1 thiamine pyrophosphate-requiring protein [Verrucomicrobiota bacterium]